jgi:hypothetical protein
MNNSIATLLRNKWVLPTSVGVTAFSSGFAAGYAYFKYRSKQEEIPEPEFTQLAIDFDEYLKATSIEDILGVGQPLHDAAGEPLTVWANAKPTPIDEETLSLVVDPLPVSVFRVDHEDDWDYESELATRTPELPYIIHADEYFNDEMGYSQTTLTFYNEDNILCDERDVPIYGHSLMVGPLLFGHGSNDQNIVYVRSEKLEHEWEIICSMGSYEVEVMGLQIEQSLEEQDLKHSHNYRFRE